MGYDHLDDEQLLVAFSQANPAERPSVFAAVYGRHLLAVLRFCASRLHETSSTEDTAADTFVEAFEALNRGTVVTKLRPWLIGIARHRCAAYRRGLADDDPRRRGTLDLLTPGGDVEPGADEELDRLENLSRRRQAEVDRLLALVVRTLTERQQQLFNLVVGEGCVGERLAERLGTSSAQASRHTYDVIRTVEDGFGALVLFLDGRRSCPQLETILDAAVAGEFSSVLRTRVVRHFSTCPTCDSCTTCAVQRRRLVAPYAPVLIPVLILATTRDRIERSIRRIAFAGPLPPVPPPRSRRRPRLSPALLILPIILLLGIGAVVVATIIGSRPGVLPASIAGTWQVAALNEPGIAQSAQPSRWSFTGNCDSAESCRFTWLPLTTTTTFESEFTQDFRDSAKQQVPADLPQNKSPDLVLVPVGNGFYSGRATAQYGIFDEQNQTFATAQETVILTVNVTTTSTDPAGRRIATGLTISVDYAAHDFDPCSALCGRQSFEDLRKTITTTSVRS